MRKRFHVFAENAAQALGSPVAFGVAVGTVLAWVIAGFFIGFGNELYQLAINTGTTIVTFIMGFLILSTENRNEKAQQAKLDALIAANDRISNRLIGMEDPDKEEERGGDAHAGV